MSLAENINTFQHAPWWHSVNVAFSGYHRVAEPGFSNPGQNSRVMSSGVNESGEDASPISAVSARDRKPTHASNMTSRGDADKSRTKFDFSRLAESATRPDDDNFAAETSSPTMTFASGADVCHKSRDEARVPGKMQVSPEMGLANISHLCYVPSIHHHPVYSLR